jgi:hypothetical protein
MSQDKRNIYSTNHYFGRRNKNLYLKTVGDDWPVINPPIALADNDGTLLADNDSIPLYDNVVFHD